MNFLAEETVSAAAKPVEVEQRFEGPLLLERAVMSAATRGLDRLLAVDTTHFTREELADHSLEIVRATDRLRTGSARFMAFADHNAAALTRGERKMSSLVNSQCGVSKRQGRELNLLGAAAERYVLFYKAVLDGRIGPGHIEVLHPVWAKVDRRHFEVCQEALLGVAEVCTPERFAEELEKWRNLVDEHPCLDEYLANQAKQHMTYGFDLFGNVHYSGTVGPEHAEPFIGTLETEAANHNTAHLKPSQARGKALVELVLNPDGKYRARLEILVPETDRGRVEDSEKSPSRQIPDPHDFGFDGVLVPRTARGTLIPKAIVDRIRRGGSKLTIHGVDEAGNIAGDCDAGRHFGAVQKRLIRLRDNRCRHHGCRRPASDCEYDHVVPHEHDGPTLIRNGQLLCKRHHRFKHRHDPGPHRSTIFDDSPLAVLLE